MLPSANSSTTRAWSIWKRSRNRRSCAARNESPSAADPLPKKDRQPPEVGRPGARRSCGLGAFCAGLYRYGKHSWRFRIDSSDQIEVAGAQHVAARPNHGSQWAAISAANFFRSAGPAQTAARADSMGRVGQRNALRAEPPAHRNPRAHAGSLRAHRLAHFSDRRGRKPDGTRAGGNTNIRFL